MTIEQRAGRVTTRLSSSTDTKPHTTTVESKQGRWQHVGDFSATRVWARHLEKAPERHVRAFGAVSYALTELRLGIFGDRSWPAEPAEALADTLALILRNLLGRRERKFLGEVAVAAMDDLDRDELAFDLGGPPPLEVPE